MLPKPRPLKAEEGPEGKSWHLQMPAPCWCRSPRAVRPWVCACASLSPGPVTWKPGERTELLGTLLKNSGVLRAEACTST